MEQYKERKFVCKYCSKRFPCGKSLGGHIRTHMNENSLDSDEDESNKLKIDDNGGQSSYGLRENPKKNKRFVDHRQMMALKQQEQQQQLLCCKECGKGFVSTKALCGHMASHSERDKIVMDSQSDTEASSSPIRRRSKRAVVRHHHQHQHQHQHHNNNFIVMDQFNSASSDASEIEPEQEEMALSLMMLSRDSSFKKGHSSESSDNNSVILETKSSTVKMKNVGELLCKENKLGVDNNNHHHQLRSGEDNGDIIYDSDNSDSGYFRNGPKKSDVSVDGFFKNNKSVIMGSGSGSGTKQDKNMNSRFGGSGSGSGSGRSSTKYDLRKSKRSFPCYGRKKIKYEQLTESVYDSGEHSLETDSCADTNRRIKIQSKSPAMVKKGNGAKKKSKGGHECPICFRVFKSGQALGGHKRSHFIGNQEHRTLVIQHQVPHEIHKLIDLNLPAPIDE